MKNLLLPFSLSIFALFSSCVDEGPIGPMGPQGPQGPAGNDGAPGESGYVFEYEDINFTASNDYAVLLEYPNDFEGLDSDVALVYFLWAVDDSGTEIWRQLPQTIFTEFGILQYNFDFTKFDVNLFLDADFNLDFLGAGDTDSWVARVVIVPGDFWNSGRIDFSDYHQVKEALGLPDLQSHNVAYTRSK